MEVEYRIGLELVFLQNHVFKKIHYFLLLSNEEIEVKIKYWIGNATRRWEFVDTLVVLFGKKIVKIELTIGKHRK